MKQIVNKRYQESYDETVLENGLRVILWHKPHYEKSLFMMVTPFGAKDLSQYDAQGNIVHHPSGIAHFLEHKMFMMQGQDVMRMFSDMGANVNAFTSYQETAYYTSTSGDPKQPLELLLDFVQELDIDDASVEKEKGIITSELHMYQEMSDQRLIMETYASLFQTHPLRYDIAGDDESIRATTKEQLYRCYEMNYHPSNMILICVSAHDSEQLLDIIRANQAKKQFPPAPQMKPVEIEEPLAVARKEYNFAMDISVPKLSVAYKLSGIPEPYERLRMEWMVRFLLDANFTSLYPQYQTWLDKGWINDFCGCDIEIGEDYGLLMFYAETSQQAQFITLCGECYQRLTQGMIEPQLMEQLKKRYFAQSVRAMNSFDDIAISFARNYFHGADMFRTIDLLKELDEQVAIQAGRYLSNRERAIVRLLQKNNG